MKRVKYYLLARGIKAFLNFVFLFSAIALITNRYRNFHYLRSQVLKESILAKQENELTI